MKKIIDGKLYNTETATHIVDWDNGLYCNDFGWCEESLYVTKKGAYFIHGEGGAMSCWSTPCGSNGTCGGGGIRVLTKAEALQWCEDRDVDGDTIAEHFEVQEG